MRNYAKAGLRPAKPRLDCRARTQFWGVLNVSLCVCGVQLGREGMSKNVTKLFLVKICYCMMTGVTGPGGNGGDEEDDVVGGFQKRRRRMRIRRRRRKTRRKICHHSGTDGR